MHVLVLATVRISAVDPVMSMMLWLVLEPLSDDCVGNLTTLLKARRMWNDTLMVMTSDKYALLSASAASPAHQISSLTAVLWCSGGPMYSNNAANNFPLRGYKFTSFEGTRVSTVVVGYLLDPVSMLLPVGGIRVNAAVVGGFIDPVHGFSRRTLGSRLQHIIHGADWCSY